MRRLSAVALGAALVLSVLPGGAASAAATVLLAPDGPTAVPMGSPFNFKIEIDNADSQTVTSDFTVSVGKSNGSAPIAFERVTQTIPPGGHFTHRSQVTPSQWLAGKGTYEISTSSGAIPLEFEVAGSPVRVPKFKDISASVGIATTLPTFDCGDWSAGAAWADVEGDGDLDLFLPRQNLPDHLWINDGGQFGDEAGPRGVASTGKSLGAVFADYDNDGDPDLYVNADGPNRFYRNDGTGNFEEISAQIGVDDNSPSQSASWGDLNNDGRLDLYVTNHARCAGGGERTYYRDRLYVQAADGSFTDIASQVPLPPGWPHDGAGFQTAWFDYDSDGDSDLYLGNDFWGNDPRPNQMWRNDGGVLENISVASNTAISMNSMGIGVADFDQDMDLDIAISNIRSPALLRNNGDGTFTNRAESAHVNRVNQDATSIAITWGTVFLDANNDGWEDLYFAAGRLGKDTNQPNAFFTNIGGGEFLDHSAPSGTNDAGIGRGIAVADFDRDGRMDMFLVNQDGSPRFFRNTTKKRRAHYLQVDTVGRVSNRDGCGATLIVKIKGAKLLRQVFCGGTSLGSGADPTVHFGLGPKKRVKKLIIKWPSGRRSVKRDLAVDRLMRIREPKA